MFTTLPHVQLEIAAGTRPRPSRSRLIATTFYWRFILQTASGERLLAAEDERSDEAWSAEMAQENDQENDREQQLDRLELLALVRGLEALDQPSHVSVLSISQYVTQGLRFGLPVWRARSWSWEAAGNWEPIRNQDLWLRVDRALQYHRVDCPVRSVDDEWYARHPELRAAGPRSVRRRLASVARQLARLPVPNELYSEQTWPLPLDNRVAYDGMVMWESAAADSCVASCPKFQDSLLHPEGMSCERP
jgi:ribonuclease HI